MSSAHSTHCCFKHGCKYGQDNCPVANGFERQFFPCYHCVEVEDAKAELKRDWEELVFVCKLEYARGNGAPAAEANEFLLDLAESTEWDKL